MSRSLFGIFVVLHGLVHLWFTVLSQELVQYKAEMGWSGESWLLTGIAGDSGTRLLATVAYAIASVAFIVSAGGLFARANWWKPAVVLSAFFSASVILLFWDGRAELLVQKGLIGFLIDLAILFSILVLRPPAIRL